MKRLIISIVILTFIAALSTASIIVMKNCNKHLGELVSQTEQAYKTGGDTKKALDDLEDYWEKYYLVLSYISSEPTMSDMSRAVKKLPDLLERGSDDFLAELKSISDWAELLYDTQFPDISSVF